MSTDWSDEPIGEIHPPQQSECPECGLVIFSGSADEETAYFACSHCEREWTEEAQS